MGIVYLLTWQRASTGDPNSKPPGDSLVGLLIDISLKSKAQLLDAGLAAFAGE